MKYWIGVVSKEHVKKGVQGGFAQVCHGKKGPLSRMKKGDWLIYYSPKKSFNKPEPCQEFTAVGSVKSGLVYQVEMFPDFHPFRIDIEFVPCQDVPIACLLPELKFVQENKNWGFKMRMGLFEIERSDFLLIAKKMSVQFDFLP